MDEGSLKSSDSKDSTYRDVLYTIDSRGNRKWVYPEIVWGKFLKGRTFCCLCSYGHLSFSSLVEDKFKTINSIKFSRKKIYFFLAPNFGRQIRFF